MQNIKDMVIVGGGTAGWITALYVRHNFPLTNVTVIESSEIGILGAGEGTTPHFVRFLKELDINIEDIFKHAKATFKNGIKFKNWNGDNQSYFHGFGDNKDIFEENYIAYLDAFINNEISKVDYQDIVSEQNKSKFTINPQKSNPTH
jgi:2-polyprenyl-6-methoxyphenol hydroxylase-like FAD-dependent oxidoreductase